MTNIFLESDNVFVRILTGAVIVFGGLSLLVGIGVVPDDIGRNIALIGLLMVVIWNYGNKAKAV